MGINFAPGCTTDNDRVKFCEELDVGLRNWHNQRCEGRGKTFAKNFFAREFYPLSAAVHLELNRYAKMEWNGTEYTKQKIGGGEIWKPNLDVIEITPVVPVIPPDPLQDLTTYVETDPNGRYTVTSTKVDVVGLTRGEAAHVLKDLGVAHFAGDYEHLFEVEVTSGGAGTAAVFLPWMVSNTIGEFETQWLTDYNGCELNVKDSVATQYAFYTREGDGGSNYNDVWADFENDPVGHPSINNLYYGKVKRDEAVGTYGTLYIYWYDDAPRSNLLHTTSIALHTSKKDYRYHYVANSQDVSAAFPMDCYSQNHDLQEVVATAIKDIIGTGIIPFAR